MARNVAWHEEPVGPSRVERVQTTRHSVTKVHLEGMSDRSVAELASLARSWESPAQMTIETSSSS